MPNPTGEYQARECHLNAKAIGIAHFRPQAFTFRILGTRKSATSSGSSAKQLMKNFATLEDVDPDISSSAYASDDTD